jgi:hypothetical protein
MQALFTWKMTSFAIACHALENNNKLLVTCITKKKLGIK